MFDNKVVNGPPLMIDTNQKKKKLYYKLRLAVLGMSPDVTAPDLLESAT